MRDGEQDDLARLFARAQAGDLVARDRLFLRLYRRLWFHVTSDLGLRHRGVVDREDIVQQALARVFGSLDRFRWNGDVSLTAFLRKVAGREAQRMRAHLEAQKRFPEEAPQPVDAQIQDGHPVPEVEVERREEAERLRAAIEQLRPEWRELIVLVELEELSVSEAARRLDRPYSTVARDLGRARARLGRLLGADQPPEE